MNHSPTDAGPALKARLEGATPVMAQYMEIKATHPDALLFFRMGDFYELFFEDAVVAAEKLSLALTKRGQHQGQEIPLAGVPAHAVESYIAKLIRLGFRVAVCEQLEDPAEAKKRGYKAVVKRGIVRVVTPGTLTEDTLLEARGSNRLAAVSGRGGVMALASVELSTGDVEVLEIAPDTLGAHLSALRPSETLVADRLLADEAVDQALRLNGGVIQPQPPSLSDPAAGEVRLKALYGVETLDGFGGFSPAEVSALGLIAAYLDLTQAGRRPVLKPPVRAIAHSFLTIDAATRSSLEIDRTQRGAREGSLMSALDMTVTSGGSRLLLSRLSRPLIDVSAINARLDAVGWFLSRRDLREAVSRALKGVSDMARALSRLGLNRGGPRDLKAIADSLALAQVIREALSTALERDQTGVAPSLIAGHVADLTPSAEVSDLLERLELALADDPPLTTREGGFIRPQYNSHLNEAVNLRNDSRRVILQMESDLQAQTGVPLKIKYNAILGYFIEVTQKQSDLLLATPDAAQFIHRQSLVNQVRYVTTALIDLDNRIQRAASDALTLELAIFDDLREEVRRHAPALQAVFDAFCAIDVGMASAAWAEDHHACRPVIEDSAVLDVVRGEHPVVVSALRAQGKPFTPNDVRLDAAGADAARLALVTGPNMAGKSTYLRQNALLILMAQAGLYVPAKSMRLGVVDRLYSRVGAGDDLAQGRSTFMMEMVETAAILTTATQRSFVILDEIGRGTSTYDGLAIAWATAEALHDQIGCRALFATHYHEMSALEQKLKACENLSLQAREHDGDLIFLHEVKRGSADRSYGVQVARLAGMPLAVVGRARDILQRLEEDNQTKLRLDDLPLFQMDRSAREPARNSKLEAFVNGLDPDNLSPKEALEVIYNLRSLVT